MTDRRALRAELAAHDAQVAARGLALTVGAEPTFTDPRSQDPWWLGWAEGGDKEARAEALLRALAGRLSGAARLARLAGRHFDGEERPRFLLGAALVPGAPAGPAARLDDAALAGPPLPPALGPGERLFTVGPDPGVVEVNLAPADGLATFHAWAEAVHGAAADAGLSPVRWRYNGQETDSGGGGQLTLGGPTAEGSPFFLHPQLLPRLVRYHLNHPALSYAFAGECLGSASQGPRPDEGARERYEELGVALDRLEARGARVGPAELWESLAPLLVDASGNSHRAELNVEKLWNPHLAGRGRMGIVELRSLRMQADPDRQAAVAALFRAVAARLATVPYAEPLADWGAALHDRQALPVFLAEDLRTVLADLEASRLGLGPRLRATLLAPPPPLAVLTLAGATLTITPAAEFWPLVGDVASQERSAARVVDASSQRVELRIDHPKDPEPGLVTASGWDVPLHPAGDRRHVAAVRWRAFTPRPGLHPGLPAQDPVVLRWDRGGERLTVELHGWRPGGGVYAGLPEGPAEAAARRAERVRVTSGGAAAPGASPGPLDGLTLDLRRLDARRPDHAG